MAASDFETINHVLSIGTIIAIVIGSIFGALLCITFLVIVICIIKRCNRSRYSRRDDMILQESYLYPPSWTNQYPPNLTSVANYPPAYQAAPPPYTAAYSGYIKPPST